MTNILPSLHCATATTLHHIVVYSLTYTALLWCVTIYLHWLGLHTWHRRSHHAPPLQTGLTTKWILQRTVSNTAPLQATFILYYPIAKIHLGVSVISESVISLLRYHFSYLNMQQATNSSATAIKINLFPGRYINLCFLRKIGWACT